MKSQKQIFRPLFFLFLLTCLVSGLVGTARVQVRAAPLLAANPLDVVFNEIAWGGTAAYPGDQWIELYNNTSSAIPLTNWRIEAEDGDPIIDLSPYSIPANGFLLLERGNSLATSVTTILGVVETGTYFAGLLSPTGETLYLLDETSTIIDQVNSDGGPWVAGHSSPAESMERYNSTSAENDFIWTTNDGTGITNGTDAKNNSIHGTPGSVNNANSLTPPTFTAITSISPEPSGVNAPVTFAVKVDGILPAPTGTVSISDGVNTLCTVTLSAGAGSCTAPISSTGTKTITATYASDTGRLPSSDTKSHVVLPISVTTTTINLVSPEPSGVGITNAVEVKVTVSGGSSAPTGTVAIGGADTNCSITLSSGTGSCNVFFSTVGNKTITATYSGDSTHSSSTTSANHVVIVISSTTTKIDSDTPDPSSTNQGVKVTVTVSGGSVTPTGTVSISGANTNCTIALVGGTGSCFVYFTSVGTKTITATYNGDSAHTGSSTTTSHQVFLPTPIPTSTPIKIRTATPAPLPPPPLIGINEFVPRPGHDWNNDGVVNVGDEYIELINHGVINVNLSGYSLDDEANVGSSPYRLPAVTLKPGERMVFYGADTGLLLSDGGDGVRLLKPNGQLGDAYNYSVAKYPDQAYCRLPDNGGLDDWNQDCFPTPGLKNSLNGNFSKPPIGEDVDQSSCPISDVLPVDFVWAECPSFGNIWSRFYWDVAGWFGEKNLPDIDSKWDVYVD